MSDVNKEVKKEEINSLAPIPEKERIMGLGIQHNALARWMYFYRNIGNGDLHRWKQTEPVAVIPRSSNWLYDPRCRYRNE